MDIALSSAELVALVRPVAEKGATTATICGLAGLREARAGDLSFLGNAKYKAEVAPSAASVVLLPVGFVGEPRPDQLFLLVENPSVALAQVCARLEQQLWPRPTAGVHPSAVVAAGARVAASATIGPLCVVEAGAVVGERTHLQAQVFLGQKAIVGADCWLQPGVVVAAGCMLHDRVRLQPGVIVGSDGFGYEFVAGHHEKVPQVGVVELGSDVEIGANTTLDRARFSRTLVGEGTKIDNLVQIAHNVVIGRHCLICGQAGISGSTTLEDYVVLGGQAGLVGHITIGRGTKIDAQSGVRADLPAGSVVKGTPSLPFQLEQRIHILRQRLPELFRRVDRLETELARLAEAVPPRV